MEELTFIFNNEQDKIQSTNNQKMNEIFNNFSTQKNISYNTLSFLYRGKEINENLTLNEFSKAINKNTKEISILVVEKDNYISCEYKINNKNEKLLIFGLGFVGKNENNCKIVYEDKVINLIEKIKIEENYNKNKLEVKLVGIKNIIDASFMFAQCNSLLSLPDISKWDTKNVINMCNMFQECSSLSCLPDISKWNTSNVKDMKYMFYGCLSLFYLPDISKWDISNVENTSYMFDSCELLSTLPDISKWNTSKVISMSNMFFHCKSLTSLPDISKWDLSNVKDIKYMFFNCLSLTEIPDISKWNIKDNTISIFLFGFCINLIKIPSKFKSEIV